MIEDDTKSATRIESNKSPRQFTLRQALLVIGALCVVLALYRAAGVDIATLVVLLTAVVGLLAVGTVKRRWHLVGFAAILSVPMCYLALPSLGESRPTAMRTHCRYTLKQIGLALQSYHDKYGSLPPPYVPDASGRPMHSWRVLLLPFLDHQPLYDQYRFDEPWDGPNNSRLTKQSPDIYRCPADDDDGPKGSEHETSYVVIVGPRTAFPGDKCVSLRDVTDYSGNTILVVEVHNSGIHWMEPRDLHVTQMAPGINPAKGQGISSKHRGGANAVMADGSVKYLDAEKLTAEDVLSLLTIDGNEPPPIPRD